jgi:hypothetical protein
MKNKEHEEDIKFYTKMVNNMADKLRESDMAFEELVSRTRWDVLQTALYELKKFKLEKEKEKFELAIKQEVKQ